MGDGYFVTTIKPGEKWWWTAPACSWRARPIPAPKSRNRACVGLSAVRALRGTLATDLIALLAGLWATRSAPLDVFPDFVPSTVDIQTEAPGFTAQQVEQLVTKPIENAVNGALAGHLRPESIPACR